MFVPLEMIMETYQMAVLWDLGPTKLGRLFNGTDSVAIPWQENKNEVIKVDIDPTVSSRDLRGYLATLTV